MAELILTEAEKAAALWTDCDDATLGALLRKKIHLLQSAAEQSDRTVAMAASLLMCCHAAEFNADQLSFKLDGVTQEGRDFGNWTVTVTRNVAAPAAGETASPRQEVVEQLADMVVAQAKDHGFAIEVDAIRGAVEQFAKFGNLDATEDEIVLACQQVEVANASDPDLAWLNDSIQFPRLLSEMYSCVEFSPEQMKALSESMDLEFDQIGEILERGALAFEIIKGNLPVGTTLEEFRSQD